MKNLKMQLAVVLLSTLCLFTGAYGQVIPSGDAATLNEEHASSAPQLTYTMLHSFDNTDGEQPEAALVQATTMVPSPPPATSIRAPQLPA